MSDSRGGCQLAAVPWSALWQRPDALVTGLWAGLSLAASPRVAQAAVGEYTADTGPPGDRPCPAGPRGGAPSGAMSREPPGGFSFPPSTPQAPPIRGRQSAFLWCRSGTGWPDLLQLGRDMRSEESRRSCGAGQEPVGPTYFSWAET